MADISKGAMSPMTFTAAAQGTWTTPAIGRTSVELAVALSDEAEAITGVSGAASLTDLAGFLSGLCPPNQWQGPS